MARKISHIGVLCSGGDAPGMNAAIRAVVRAAIYHGCEVTGIKRGFQGLLEEEFTPLQASSVANIIHRGGTILKTARSDGFFKRSERVRAGKVLKQRGVGGLVVIGGDGSFRGAKAFEEDTGLKSIGIPGTIDNDIEGSEDTIGFDTALNTVIQSIDRIRDTASSHSRTFLIEVMGRHCGAIAIWSGIGGGAESIVIPETWKNLNHEAKIVADTMQKGIRRGKGSSIILVAEGEARDLSNGTRSRAEELAIELQKHGFSSKICILGHTQRGGSPTAHDRMLASTLGAKAVETLLSGVSGKMVAIRNGNVVVAPYPSLRAKRKSEKLSPKLRSLLRLASILSA